MSLILEALRRSEAERRRAAPPSLLGGGDAPRARATSPWPMALAGLAIGLVLAGTAAWWFAGRADGTPGSLPAAADAASARPSEATVAAPRPPIGASPDAAIEPVPPAAYGPSSAPATPPSRAATAAPVATAPPAPRASPAATAPPTSEPRAAPQALASSEPRAPTVPAPPPSPPPASTAAADAAASGLGPLDGDLPWSALATGSGEPLPAPRISMHVYADDPSRRFAIVDGQRRREGDLLHAGMPLLEIRRDGLRVGWQGRVLWVPR